MRDTFIDDVTEGVRARVDGLLDDFLTRPRPFDRDPHLVRCPVRAVHGTSDDWEPLRNLKRMLAEIPDAQLVALDGLNHLGP